MGKSEFRIPHCHSSLTADGDPHNREANNNYANGLVYYLRFHTDIRRSGCRAPGPVGAAPLPDSQDMSCSKMFQTSAVQSANG